MPSHPKQLPKLILGCSNFGSPSNPHCRTTTPIQAAALLTTFASYGHTTIDTSRHYSAGEPGTSEGLLGPALTLLQTGPNPPPIHIDTKVLSSPGMHTPSNIARSISASLSALQVPSVHTIYLHFPDRTVPFTSPISALSLAVSSGQAAQWGLSNYTLADVREILALCDEHNLIRPAVFQGEYNALNRSNEALIHYLHDQNIAFYAYSPAAGGVFSPSGTRLTAQTPAGEIWRQRYGSEETRAAIQKVRDAATENGLGGHEVAMRWAVWDGVLDEKFGDGVVIGAGSEEQLKATCELVKKGGLEDEIRSIVEDVWESIGKEKETAQKE